MKIRKKSFSIKLVVIILLFILLLNARIAEPFLRLMGKSSSKKGSTSYKTSVPVLMYHSISDNKDAFFTLKKEKFREQMQYVKENGFKTLTLDELNYYLDNGKKLPEKSLVITFDDGYKDNYKNAYPILKEYGLKATVFVIADYVRESAYYLDDKELREMNENGIDIQCHTLNHDKLDKLSYDNQFKILQSSKSRLEEAVGKEVKYLAYPFGRYNKDTISAAKRCGYKMAFTTHLGYCTLEDENFKIRRICVPGYTGLSLFKRILY